MGKVVVLVVLALLPMMLPAASATTVCAPAASATGVCVSAGTDAGTYASLCRFASCASTSTLNGHTASVHDNILATDDATLDADADGVVLHVEQHDRIDVTNREDVDVIHLSANGQGVYAKAGMVSDHPWFEADVTGQHAIITSHACFVANADRTLVGVACGDWANGEVTPVFENHVMDTVNGIRNDPLVRCVMSRTCIV